MGLPPSPHARTGLEAVALPSHVSATVFLGLGHIGRLGGPTNLASPTSVANASVEFLQVFCSCR